MTSATLERASPLTELQRRVVEAARHRLQKYPWYSGICLDQLPSDDRITRNGFISAVDGLVIDTVMWDA